MAAVAFCAVSDWRKKNSQPEWELYESCRNSTNLKVHLYLREHAEEKIRMPAGKDIFHREISGKGEMYGEHVKGGRKRRHFFLMQSIL